MYILLNWCAHYIWRLRGFIHPYFFPNLYMFMLTMPQAIIEDPAFIWGNMISFCHYPACWRNNTTQQQQPCGKGRSISIFCIIEFLCSFLLCRRSLVVFAITSVVTQFNEQRLPAAFRRWEPSHGTPTEALSVRERQIETHQWLGVQYMPPSHFK